MQTDRIKAAVVELLEAIGEDPNRPALKNTPTKVAEAYTSFFRGIGVNPQSVIELVSICEHHLLPFTGVAHIAYLPNKKLAGLGRLASVLEVLAARPQLQENLTAEVADALEEALDAKGVLVVIEARHQCVASRGARQPDVNTVTLASRGLYTEPSYRAEVLGLINKKS